MIDIKRYGEWILVLVTLIAAFGWVFSKEAIAGMPPFGFIGLRFLLAAIILLPVCLLLGQAIKLIYLPKALFSGAWQTINMNLWILAISYGGALGEGSFIMSLSILMIPLIAWLLFKEKPLTVFWVSLPIAVLGLGFLSLSGGWQGSVSQIWFFLSALSFAIFFNFNSRFVKNIPVLAMTCIQLFLTGTFSLLISLIFESWPATISWSVLTWFLASVVIATSLRYALQLVGQKYVSIGNAAIIMILEPIFTTILSILFYQETLSWQKWTGCGFILIALIIYRGYVFIRSRHAYSLPNVTTKLK